MNLRNKTIVVTGGLGSLGSFVANATRAAGANVAVIDFNIDGKYIPSTVSDLLVLDADLTEEQSAKTAMTTIAAQFGQLDGLINIAGGFVYETFETGNISSWEKMYRMNLRTALCACKAALPYLLQSRSGRIVNIGANAAIKANSGMGAYTASKAGIEKLTEALADELKDRGLTVNAVLPSVIDTPANRAEMPNADFTRWVKPSDISELIIFLLSQRASAVTGALIPIVGRV